MLFSLRVKQDDDRVVVIWSGRKVCDVPYGEALVVAGWFKLLAEADPGSWQAEGRCRVVRTDAHVQFVYAGRLAFAVPAGRVAQHVAGSLHQAAKRAEHWKTLNVTAERERLYADQELLISKGFPRNLNLGVPNMEFAAMGGHTAGLHVEDPSTVHVPRVTATTPEERARKRLAKMTPAERAALKKELGA